MTFLVILRILESWKVLLSRQLCPVMAAIRCKKTLSACFTVNAATLPCSMFSMQKLENQCHGEYHAMVNNRRAIISEASFRVQTSIVFYRQKNRASPIHVRLRDIYTWRQTLYFFSVH